MQTQSDHKYQFIVADNEQLPFSDQAIDLVLCSPPYEDARAYGIEFNLKGQDWVEWAIPRFLECVRVCRGLVAWVIEGKTRDFRWSATPALFMADLHRAGVKLRKPPAFARVGIPGSGGPDWLRNDYEFIVCASHGKLPWSDNTAMGHAPRYASGGACSNRTREGKRVRDTFGFSGHGGRGRNKDGTRKKPKAIRATSGSKGGDTQTLKRYAHPKKANPGNVIHCRVGGGQMGHALAHENEAPYPEALADFFIRSFCPPGGVVLDPFSGSGTTVAAAVKAGRCGVGIDVRQSQIDLGKARLADVCLTMKTNAEG